MKKKKFRVYGIVHGTKYLGEFEAANKKKAVEMALDSEANYVSLCHQCSEEVEFDDGTCTEALAEEVTVHDE